MKKGTPMMRVIVLVIFLALCAYIGFNTFHAVSNSLKTTVAVDFSVEQSISVSGLIIRDETLIEGGSGIVEIVPGEGEKVGVGQTVAVIYGDEAALERGEQILRLKNQLDQLNASAYTLSDMADANTLDQNIVTNILSVRSAVENGDLTDISEIGNDLKNLVLRQEYTFGDGGGLDGLIERLSDELYSLEAAATGSETKITAPQSGIFSGLSDGFETVATPDILDSITPSGLDSLLDRSVSDQDGGCLGKLILGLDWYYVVSMSEDDARSMSVGNTVKINFGRQPLDSLKMTVVRISGAEDGQVAVVFSCDSAMSDTTLLRKQAAKIICSSYSGLKIPKQALRVDEEGVAGVYCIEALQAQFRAVEVVYEGDDYYLVKAADDSASSLRAGDQIIVDADNIYNGMVLD